jgi:uncharacterized protein YxeA
MKKVMKQVMQKVMKKVIAGMLVVVAIVGVSALTIHTPSQNSAARSLNSIQTGKATLFYANTSPKANWFVEQVLPGTAESTDATENLKSVAAAL